MNTLIQNLAEQAKNSIPKDQYGVAKWIELYNQSFANLLVFECIKIAVFKGDTATAKAIKEHFGVAE